nr:hypothetical protein [uncultured Merdimonas sp.]
MRLIDADKLYNWVRRECNPYGNPTIDFESGNRMLDMIKRSSTAFDREKVIKELEDMKDIPHDDSVEEIISTKIWNKAIKKAIGIVEKSGLN